MTGKDLAREDKDVRVQLSDLVERIAAQKGLSRGQVEEVTEALFEHIALQMLAGASVSIHGFGTFSTRPVKSRRNDATWAPQRPQPTFRPGQTLCAKFK